MCGIIGYTGFRPACSILLEGLGRLEYRGYDSAGILVSQDGELVTIKAKGRLDSLRQKIGDHPPVGTSGMGHTRWATHGEPSDENSHPHGTKNLALVHNGIIENYIELKRGLIEKGYQFLSQTDTEIAAATMDLNYDGDPVSTIAKSLRQIEGSYAFVIMFRDFPDTVYAVRKDGPLLVAPGDGENFVVSDLTAAIGYTNRYFTLDEGEIAVLTRDSVRVVDLDGNPVEKTERTVGWSIEQAQKDGFEHFMLKEITEQPAGLRNTIHPRIKNGLPSFSYDQIPEGFFASFDRIQIVACGTAMHAGLVGKAVIEQVARIPVEVEVASEFRYRNPILGKRTLVVVISQSGETADSLAALRLARSLGVTTLAVVNVAGSSIAREADYVIHTHAGPEISVASTKAYSVQVSALYLLAFSFGLAVKRIDEEEAAALVSKLEGAVDAVGAALDKAPELEQAAKRFSDVQSLFFLGRGLDWALANEGSLKLKEISYIHCEAYAAGELKHGTISLITEGIPVIALATQQRLMGKMVSNIKEVKARGADVLLIAKSDETVSHDVADTLVTLSPIDDLFMPFPAVVLLQLIAYYTAKERGCDIDKPRNLAKSVTVE